MRRNWYKVFLLLMLAGVLAGMVILKELNPGGQKSSSESFNGKRAMRDVEYQMALGPRIPGSQAHTITRDWLVKGLVSEGWNVKIQQTEMMGHPIHNVIAKWGEGRPWIILGAHYDSRLFADKDPFPENLTKAVPGANDGASGVAVLLELSRILPNSLSKNISNAPSGARQVWLVFFDAEDNGDIPGWDWILGSQAFVQSLEDVPDAAIIVDMVGDRNLKIYWEKNSDPRLTEEIWNVAAELGHSRYFSKRMKYRILDDHIPFLNAGIPAIDIIDYEYPYHHTVSDTSDKVSARSMQIVGETLLKWFKITKF